MASVSVSGQNKDENDLLVIKQIGKFHSTEEGALFLLVFGARMRINQNSRRAS